MKQELMKVVSQRLIAHNIYEMVMTGELVKEMNTPGQFLHCLAPRADLLLRRPISIADINHQEQTCTIIYRADGDGTRAMSTLVADDTIDIMGPLGKGFPVEDISEREEILIVGGGIGVPPLHEVAKQAYLRGAKVTSLLGFATEKVVYYEEAFRQFGDTLIATDDGSYGFNGHVGQLLAKHLEENPTEYSAIYACGAKGMLKLISDSFGYHPRAYVSMEERMACGMGACYACNCQVKQADGSVTTKKVCDQGPVFKAGEVVL